MVCHIFQIMLLWCLDAACLFLIRVRFSNVGLIEDLRVYVEQHKMLNIWTEKEKEIFKEK